MTRTAVVMGSGIIGTTTAWCLAERGFDVTVIERREGVGLETSFANGGLLTPSQADPWNAPGTARRLLKWLGHDDSPLLLRLGALPGMASWGVRFLLASRTTAYRHSARASVRLGLYSVRKLDELRERLGLSYDQRLKGTIKIFQDATAFAESVELADFLARDGLRHETLKPDAAIEREPALAPLRDTLAGAIYYPADESGDAYQFTRALAQAAEHAGVNFKFGTAVRRIETDSNSITAIQTDAGDFTADAYVLASGCGSHALGRQCGLRLPIYPAKGYSITAPLKEWRGAPAVPIVDFTRKLVLTPLGERLRIAGTAEFAGYDKTLTRARSDHVLNQALKLFPDFAPHVDRDQIERWTGLRPMTPDGPPIIGATACGNLFLNTGHGPLGWTFAAGSSQLTADIVAGRTPEIDATDFRYDRFH